MTATIPAPAVFRRNGDMDDRWTYARCAATIGGCRACVTNARGTGRRLAPLPVSPKITRLLHEFSRISGQATVCRVRHCGAAGKGRLDAGRSGRSGQGAGWRTVDGEGADPRGRSRQVWWREVLRFAGQGE